MIGVEAGMEFPLPVCEQQAETNGTREGFWNSAVSSTER